MQRAVVTGGFGFIGRHLVPSLLTSYDEVIVLDSFDPDVHGSATPPLDEVPPGCQLMQVDVRSSPDLNLITWDDADVIHLAAKTGVGDSMYRASSYSDVNCTGLANLIDHFNSRAKPRRLVIASSRAIYGEGSYFCDCGNTFQANTRSETTMRAGAWDPPCNACGHRASPLPMAEDLPPNPASPYGATKLFQERLANLNAKAQSYDCVILRLFNVYGEGQSLWNPYTGVIGNLAVQAAHGHPMTIFEDGVMLRDFVHVADVVNALRLALDVAAPDNEGPINVASGCPVTLFDLAVELSTLLGSPSPQVTADYRLGDVRHVIGTRDRAARVLGFQPTVSLRDGLEAYLDWFLGQQLPPCLEDPTTVRRNA